MPRWWWMSKWWIDWEFWVVSRELILFCEDRFIASGSAETIIPLAKRLGAKIRPARF